MIEAEMVADSMSDVFDENTVRDLMNENRSRFDKIRAWFDDLLPMRRGSIEKLAESRAEVGALQNDLDTLSEIRELFFHALDNAQNGQKNITHDEGDVKYSIRKEFAGEYDTWDKKQPEKHFVVGTTSEALKRVGVEDREIIWDASKIIKIKIKHKNMTDSVIKQVPNILDNPILIMNSISHKSRLTLFGEVYDNAGKPVLAVLELSPTTANKILLDEIKIASAYGKDSAQSLINRSNVLYVDSNKKKNQRLAFV